MIESDESSFSNCYVGHDNVVNLLLEAGVNVNLRNNKGQTALMLAASCGNESVGYFLLQVYYLSLQLRVHALADLGCARDAPPLSGPISFIFMHFPAKILSNDRLSAQTQRLAPPSGKFWIRHCHVDGNGSRMWPKCYLSKLCSSQEKDTTLRSYKLLMLGTSRQIPHTTRCFTSVPVYGYQRNLFIL